MVKFVDTFSSSSVTSSPPTTALSTTDDVTKEKPVDEDVQSFDDYLKNQKDEQKQNEELLLQEYLGSKDAFYTKEYLNTLKPNRLLDILYEEDRDLVNKYIPESETAKEREYIVKSVPSAIAPFVRVIAKGSGFTVIKPLAEVDNAIAEDIEKTMEEINIEDISKGAEAKARDLTLREKHEGGVATLIQKVGLADNNFTARQMAKSVVGSTDADAKAVGIGAADFAGLGSIYAFQEAGQEIERLRNQNASAVNYIAPAAVMGLSALEAFPATKLLARGAKSIIKGTPFRTPVKTIDEIREEIDLAKVSEKEKYRNELSERKYNIGLAKGATERVRLEKAEVARKEALKNQDILEDLIESYEFRNKVDISKVVEGKKVIDYEKARGVSKSRLHELDGLDEDSISSLGFGDEGYRNPILNPDKLDAVVAAIADIKKAKPDSFKDVGKGKDQVSTVEAVFRASVEQDFVQTDKFKDILTKYNLSMDDYLQLVTGSGSLAGSVLQKFRTIKNAMGVQKTPEELYEEKVRKALDNSGFRQGFRRFENIVRGALVSAFATAARNFEGFLIRAPIEGLTSMFENGIHMAATKGTKFELTDNLETIKENPFKRSFQIYGDMFSDQTNLKDYTDFILKRPEAGRNYERFYNQVAEIQQGLGRGQARERQIKKLILAEKELAEKEGRKFSIPEARKKAEEIADKTPTFGKVMDHTLTELEDMVHFLNTPNRFQEFLARRTFFLSHLEQLVKREYKLDLMPTLNEGKIMDLFNGTRGVVPEGARQFQELVTEATERALTNTYAAGPKFAPFRSALDILSGIPGSTFFLPFPKFMFKSMEYMYETTAGLPTATVRKILFGKDFVGKKGEITYNGEMLARGMAGWSVLGGAFLASKAGFIQDDNKVIVNDKAIDITPQFPAAQLAYLGKAIDKLLTGDKGDFDRWFKANEFIKLFSGTTFRVNTGLGEFVDDIYRALNNTAKVGSQEKMIRDAGSFIAEIGTRLFQPYQQVIDFERAVGLRDRNIRTYRKPPILQSGEENVLIDSLRVFGQGMEEKFRQKGLIPQEVYKEGDTIPEGKKVGDFKNPRKEYAIKQGGRQINYPAYKLILGVNVMDKYTEEEEYLHSLGIQDYDIQSRLNLGDDIDNALNETMNGIMPILVRQTKAKEESFFRFLKNLSKRKNKKFDEDQARSDSKEFAKSSFETRLKILKTKFNTQFGKFRGSSNPRYFEELFKLKNYSKDVQRKGEILFRNYNGRTPNLNDVKDVKALNDIIKKSKDL